MHKYDGVRCTWAHSQDSASAVAAGGPRVPRVHAQAIEHIAEIQAHSVHRHLHSTGNT